MDRIPSRRDFLSRSLRFGALAGVGAMGLVPLSAQTKPPQNSAGGAVRKLKILVAGGHPGDPEYGCGGTIARYTDLGHEAVLLYLNRGEGGLAGKTGAEAGVIRTAEAKRACELLKARPIFVGQTDGQATVDASRYGDVFAIIDSEHPDVIFTQWPIDNHRDHRAISNLVYDAWLQLRKIHPERQVALYYYEVSDGEDTLMFSPTDYVDITSVEARKRAACFAHASQSPERYYDLQSQVARFRGFESHHGQAEAFVRHARSPKDLLIG